MGVAVEDKLDPAVVQQLLQAAAAARGIVQERVAGLGRVVGVEREVEERELQPTGMGGQVGLASHWYSAEDVLQCASWSTW